jgi:hypothetical protein
LGAALADSSVEVMDWLREGGEGGEGKGDTQREEEILDK